MRILLASVALLLTATTAPAATLNVVGGQLLGASDIDVGGQLYDVDFLDGTCIALFRECDSAADFTFTFTTANDAVLAAQALLDQVFLDSVAGPFDTSPSRTAGCPRPGFCLVFIPYDVDVTLFAPILIAGAWNGTLEWRDSAFDGVDAFFSSNTFGDGDSKVWAVWTLVPEPTPALFTLLGLAGLGCARRAKPSQR